MGDYDETDTSRLVELGVREFCDSDDFDAERCCPECGFTDLREDSRFGVANTEVSDGGPLTHESTETRTRRSLH